MRGQGGYLECKVVMEVVGWLLGGDKVVTSRLARWWIMVAEMEGNYSSNVVHWLREKIFKRHGYAVSSLMDTAYWSSE
ncbi:hypothetical protein Tco_0676700 [Tanacetum coccineum]